MMPSRWRSRRLDRTIGTGSREGDQLAGFSFQLGQFGDVGILCWSLNIPGSGRILVGNEVPIPFSAMGTTESYLCSASGVGCCWLFKLQEQLCVYSQDGVFPLARSEGGWIFLRGNQISATNLIEKGTFKYIESPSVNKFRRDFAGQKLDERAPVPVMTEWISESLLNSQYVVNELDLQPVELWFRPPLSIYGIEVKERSSGKLLAKATDWSSAVE